MGQKCTILHQYSLSHVCACLCSNASVMPGREREFICKHYTLEHKRKNKNSRTKQEYKKNTLFKGSCSNSYIPPHGVEECNFHPDIQ